MAPSPYRDDAFAPPGPGTSALHRGACPCESLARRQAGGLHRGGGGESMPIDLFGALRRLAAPRVGPGCHGTRSPPPTHPSCAYALNPNPSTRVPIAHARSWPSLAPTPCATLCSVVQASQNCAQGSAGGMLACGGQHDGGIAVRVSQPRGAGWWRERDRGQRLLGAGAAAAAAAEAPATSDAAGDDGRRCALPRRCALKVRAA